jgi:outer membrane cobalamin receptor
VFDQMPGTWQNIQASRARGLEFSSQAKLASWLSLSGNYTRMWTRVTRSYEPDSLYDGVGQDLPLRPGNSGAASLAIAKKRWRLQTGAVLVGERQESDMFGVTRARGYQSVYAAGSFRLNRNVVPFLRVENALDSHYQEILGYPALSRSVHGGLRLEW